MIDIVVHGATYAGTSLVTTVGNQRRMVLRLVRGLDDSLVVRGSDTVVPSLAGRIARARIADRRVIELAGPVMGTGATEALQLADLRAAMETLRTLFSPTRTAANLVIALENGGTATISARPVNMVVSPVLIPAFRMVSVELESVAPTWVIA